MSELKKLFTPDDLAELLSISRDLVMELNRDKKWPHVRFGRRVRWTEEQVAEIVRRQSVAGQQPPLPGQTKLSWARSRP